MLNRRTWSGSPSKFRNVFHTILFLQMKKVLVLPWENKDRKSISAVPPCLPKKFGHLSPVPTHRLPVNAGKASEDTKVAPFPLPSAAHLLPRFSLRSQLCETLCGCACSFTSAS